MQIPKPVGKAIILAGDSLAGVNSMAAPGKISPLESKFENASANFTYNFPAHSMTVLRIKAR